MFKAVVFDIDNTLTNDVSWLRITELLGASVAEHEYIFQRFTEEALSYEQAKAQLIALWRATGKAQKAHWEALFQSWPLVKDAPRVVSTLKAQGYTIALITGSIDLFAKCIADQLQISHWHANTITEWSPSGELLDFHYVKDQAAQKLTHLQMFCDKLGIMPTDCVAIGDGENDIEVFRATKHGIAIGQGNSALKDVAWEQTDQLAGVLDILE